MKNETFQIYDCTNKPVVYAVIDGELTAVKLRGQLINPLDGETFYELFPSENIRLLRDCPLYDSEEAFRKNTPKPKDDIINIKEILLKNRISFDEDKFGDIQPYMWQFIDGQPQKVLVNLGQNSYCTCTSKHNVRIFLLNEKTDDVPIEDWGYFKSYEDCIRWNDYTVVNADGTKKMVKSAPKQLMLTDKQTELIEALEKAIQAAKDGGIKFVYCSDYEAIVPVNGLEHKLECDYGTPICVPIR